MPMKRTAIRLPESLWDLVEREAARDGISNAQWIRDSALLRLGYRAGARGEGKEIPALFERVLRDSPPR